MSFTFKNKMVIKRMTTTTETPIAIGLLIPENIRNDDVEIVAGIWNIVNGVVYYSQCELPDGDLDKLENSGFEGEGIYANDKMIDPLDYPDYHTIID